MKYSLKITNYKLQKNTVPLYQRLLIILGFFIPFSFALSPTENIDLNILKLFIPIIFLFWLSHSLLTKKILLDARPRFYFLIIFLFITILSFFWTTAPESAFRKILFFITTMPLYFTVYSSNYTTNFKNKLLKSLVFGAFVIALLSLIIFSLQFIIGLVPILELLRKYTAPIFLGNSLGALVNQYSSWLVNISGKTILRTLGTFPDPHLFSLYLSILLPISLYLYQKYSQKKYLFFSLIILLAILFSFSRAAYLAIIFGGIFLLVASITKKIIQKKILLLYTIFVFFLFLLIIPNPLISRLNSSFNFQEGSNSGRIEMWQVAINDIKQHPIAGLGLGGFADNLNSSLGVRNPIYAHNLLLDFGAETGIFNMFILLFLLFSPIVFFLKNIKRANFSPDNLSKFIATSFVIFFIHSMFETPFFSIRVFPLFLILLAIIPVHRQFRGIKLSNS